VLKSAKASDSFGIEVEGVRPNLRKMQDRTQGIVARLVKGIEYLFMRWGIRVIKGEGSLLNPKVVKVDGGGTRIEADRVIIATGSRPSPLPGFDFNDPAVLTSTEALNLKEIPRGLLIIGGGVVGCEMATIFNGLGTDVTIVEQAPQILPEEDEKCVRYLQQAMERHGIRLFLGAEIADFRKVPSGGVRVELRTGESIHTERMLVCVGRSPNSEGLGLDEVGVERDNLGFIKVNRKLETNISGIYAVGDVTGGALLAYVASAEGRVAAENALGGELEMDYSVIPNCIFTHPEVASVGISFKEAKEEGRKVRVGSFQFGASARALCEQADTGFVQVITDWDTDRVIGGQIVGPGATELVHELALAVRLGATSRDLGSLVHGHPTLGEAIQEAANRIHRCAIHAI
jgi:dihydrolipoamide dehydrogenase